MSTKGAACSNWLIWSYDMFGCGLKSLVQMNNKGTLLEDCGPGHVFA